MLDFQLKGEDATGWHGSWQPQQVEQVRCGHDDKDVDKEGGEDDKEYGKWFDKDKREKMMRKKMVMRSFLDQVSWQMCRLRGQGGNGPGTSSSSSLPSSL